MTIKNHYIPCFWSAYWNFEYLNAKRENFDYSYQSRKVNLLTLNLKSNKIYTVKTEDIFLEKKLGLAKVLSKADSSENNKADEITYDFENLFTAMENSYKDALENLITNHKKIDEETKFFLASIIVCQNLKNPILLKDMEDFYKIFGMGKIEMLNSLHSKLSDYQQLAKFYVPIITPKWKIYIIKKNIFPICDNHILGRNHNIMFAVAPNIMIEIDLKEDNYYIGQCVIKRKISYFKYREFIKRTIRNTSKNIVFGEKELLLKIQKSNTYKKHLKNTNVCSQSQNL